MTACSYIFRRTHPCFIGAIRIAEGRCVAQEVLFSRNCARRNAHHTLHRAHRKDEGHHPVRWLSGSLKRKHAHRKVLSGELRLCHREWTKNPAEMTGLRYKNVYLVIRTQKWMGSSAASVKTKTKNDNP